jgi:methionyl-tRNA formyltransferase
MEKNYILVTEKSWHDELYQQLKQRVGGKWSRIKVKEDLTLENIKSLDPEWIFFPHWSHMIPSEIFENFQCVVFHMTDLPYGRGGSPLQNLIVAGNKETKISAIKVTRGIDTGDVYLKKPLSLDGSAKDIFIRASSVIRDMIETIITNRPLPQPQTGEPTIFKRRKPSESNIESLQELSQVYDHIRMLDCEGYPAAFIETAGLRFEFTNASLIPGQSIEAHVRITKK